MAEPEPEPQPAVEAPSPTDASKLTEWAIQCLRPEVRCPNEIDAVELAVRVWSAANDRINPPPPAANAEPHLTAPAPGAAAENADENET